MRIIKETTLKQFCQEHANAKKSLINWMGITKQATWENFNDVIQTFKKADNVRVKSKRTTVVFNIKNNDFRLITAIHYNHQIVFILRFLTHKEYDLAKWKEEL